MVFLARRLALLAGVAWMMSAAASAIAGPAAAVDRGYLSAAPGAIDWWRQARFGLFIHWGPVSLKGTEIGWSRGGERRGHKGQGEVPADVYDNLYKEFNPVRFDARQWVATAKAAGMKYLVFTTKHHDGFAMFDSKLTDYKITRSPFGRDVTAELAAACHEGGLRLGFYYSPPDWHHPDYRTARHDRYVEYLHGQLRELCSNYGQVDIIWFDGLGGTAADWDSPALFRLIRTLQPGVIINNRAGLPGDHDTPEQTIGRFQTTRPWESCITICRQWAWKPNDQLKSLQECIHTLVRCAGGDGNLLLNVGPMPTGEIEPRQVRRLEEIGEWLKDHGESIYGTRGGPWRPGTWGACTSKDNRAYLHVLKWPDGPLTLPPIARKVLSASVMGGGKAEVLQRSDRLEVVVPEAHREPIDTVVVIILDGPAFDAATGRLASGSLAAGKRASASNVFRGMAEHGPDKAVDDDPDTRWATDAGTREAWLEVDLGGPVRIDRAVIAEAYPGRVREFEIQVKNGQAWQTVVRGQGIGDQLESKFEPVTASVVRLVILKATEGPTIWEFQVFGPKR